MRKKLKTDKLKLVHFFYIVIRYKKTRPKQQVQRVKCFVLSSINKNTFKLMLSCENCAHLFLVYL